MRLSYEAHGGESFLYRDGKSLNRGSNPLQFLKTSVEHGLIFFNFEDARWDWDEEKISKLEVSENIVEYIIQNTLRGSLRQDTVEILKFAACLGTRNFNTFVLSNVLQLPVSEVGHPYYAFNLTLLDHAPLVASCCFRFD